MTTSSYVMGLYGLGMRGDPERVLQRVRGPLAAAVVAFMIFG